GLKTFLAGRGLVTDVAGTFDLGAAQPFFWRSQTQADSPSTETGARPRGQRWECGKDAPRLPRWIWRSLPAPIRASYCGACYEMCVNLDCGVPGNAGYRTCHRACRIRYDICMTFGGRF
ncbi:MAG: hypothetical protein SNJ76_12625, partial [Fimbriimonadaceae bacterium]